LPHVDSKRLRLVSIVDVDETIDERLAVNLLNLANLVWVACACVNLDLRAGNPQGVQVEYGSHSTNEILVISFEELALGHKIED
jgi:hypothetical protein